MKAQELVLAINEQKSIIEESKKAYDISMKNMLKELAHFKEKLNLLKEGLDLDKATKGLEVIAIKGEITSDQRRACISEAISALAAGGGGLKKGYFGVKIYSGFGDQRCDCSYGMGPRHGNIVFSVGLSRDCRQIVTDDQIEAGIYTLLNIDAVLKAKKEAA
jgi:hypothetical protein